MGTMWAQAMDLGKKTLLSECCRVFADDVGLELPFSLLTCFDILLSISSAVIPEERFLLFLVVVQN